MKQLVSSTLFKRDLKRVKKRGQDLSRLQNILTLLQHDDDLPERCRPHKLSGNYSGTWECHIEPDWLLIYRIEDDVIGLVRTGSHSDLFK